MTVKIKDRSGHVNEMECVKAKGVREYNGHGVTDKYVVVYTETNVELFSDSELI